MELAASQRERDRSGLSRVLHRMLTVEVHAPYA